MQLPALRSLHLTDACGLTDEGLAGLAGRLGSSLTDLSLLGCRNLRGVALRDIATACPRLRSLAISRSTVQAIAFEPVSRLEGLESLSVAACARTDYTPVLNLLAACPRTPLRAVALSDVGPLHDAPVLRAIDGCANLTSLVLAPCPYLTETFLSLAVMRLPHLLRLALSGCTQVSDGTLSLLAAHLPSIEELVLTESGGFTDTGLFALEGCSRLKQLSLHPLEKVTAVGLEALCDQCDALEGLLLAHCPAASMSVLEQVQACCLHLRVLIVTHAPNATEAGVRRMLSASDVLRVFAVVPGAGEPRMLLPPDAAERLADEFADALLVTTWADLDAVLDVEVQPLLRPKPPLRLKLPPRLTRPLPPRPSRPAPPPARTRRG